MFQSLKGFGGLWNAALDAEDSKRSDVSIPERVWWFVEQTIDVLTNSDRLVSIPERVWWFVERGAQSFKDYLDKFQSLKGFGGLWNCVQYVL